MLLKAPNTPEKVQAIFSELRMRGWTQQQLEALGSGNFERVLGQVEAAASS